MNNIKGYAVASDGNMRRIAITYDVIDAATGKPLKVNVRANNFIVGEEVLEAISVIDKFAQSIVDDL